MKQNKLLRKRIKQIPRDIDLFVEHSFEIADKIYDILLEKEIDQKLFADMLDKHESEISKWLTGTHNFTLKTISKIETVLDCKIIACYQEIDENLVTIDINAYHYLCIGNNSSKENLVENKNYNAKLKVEKYPMSGLA